MPKLHKTHISKHSVDELYALVKDIENYPTFLPWCSKARVISQNDSEIMAELDIAFKGFSESYISKVELSPTNNGTASIKAIQTDGPFSQMETIWEFKSEGNLTRIDFYINFDFKSLMLKSIAGIFFTAACDKILNAFDKRADELYGNV
jgi:coenzyme Q-binding protein COQ10